MLHRDFTIGQNFWTATGEWRCTDVGTRTIAAIKLDHPDDPSWYNGPTYAVEEIVFDEDDHPGCYATLTALQEDFPGFDPAAVPRGKIVTVQVPPPMVRLVLTCSACPEQYDAFLGERQIGYLRLRHGYFRVDAPDHHAVNGTTIYEATPKGDGFFDDDERDRFLSFAVEALLRFDRGEWEKPADLPTPKVRYEIEGGPAGWPGDTPWLLPEAAQDPPALLPPPSLLLSAPDTSSDPSDGDAPSD